MSFSFKTLRTVLAFSCVSLTGLAPLHAAELPAVPDDIKEAGQLRAGVRCDQPPYGFQDGSGEFAGVEVEMSRQIALWALGSKDKVTFTCVTAENRVPQLLGRKVDFLIATLGVTPERQRVIDFTTPYRWGASDVVVKKDSPIRKITDLNGKTLATLKGSVQAKWFEDHMPEVKTLRMNSAADALQTFRQGRADAYTHDAATLVVVADNDKNARLLNEPFQISDAAIGVRKNEAAWRDYLSAAVARMHEEKLFRVWVQQYVPENIQSYYLSVFEQAKPAEAL
ncbi:transporter substrate-binding domain-containing protein [Pseudomonas kuykendallii]|uniref:Amino acid ABC transporter substrate-binding protein, PAAT family n=1 Tax=Pseudomonas kuykendallii TaxID=1007099 RepID=A0A1H2WAE7_9PSED|nr:transporter substrate-binding domain-containing protein [Pseudomonas kuykendallii]MCQ4273041.1 transporter substrate-binding domain-containing protein [Pseudomonas kuykendallii]SDW77488.1 amino acid ABC transporter substrate-binding protein, PAAT family [Pseudomonas kuykendallii]